MSLCVWRFFLERTQLFCVCMRVCVNVFLLFNRKIYHVISLSAPFASFTIASEGVHGMG